MLYTISILKVQVFEHQNIAIMKENTNNDVFIKISPVYNQQNLPLIHYVIFKKYKEWKDQN